MNTGTNKRLDARLWSGLIAAMAVTVWTSPSLAKPADKHDPAHREQMLQKISALKVTELSRILELDAAGSAELAARLKPFDEERTRLRVESFAAMKKLRNPQGATGSSNGVDAAALLARNRVKLAQIDEREMQEVLKGLSGEKAEKASLFMLQFPRRVEKMADKMHKRRHENRKKD